MSETTTEEAIDFILKYNLEYAPKRAIYDYCQQIVRAAGKKEAADNYEKALSMLSPSNALEHQIDSKCEALSTSIVNAALKNFPDSRFASGAVWLSKIKNTRFPKGNGLIAVAIRYALCCGNVDLLNFVLKNGYNRELSIPHYSGIAGTALMWSSLFGYSECVNSLINAGADVNAKSKEGWTSLMYAARKGHPESVVALIAANASLDVTDAQGWTALMLAACYGHTGCVKTLIDSKAKLNVQDKDGWTALMLAVRHGHTECAKVLIAAKADLNLKDKEGCTALMLAARYGRTECIKALIAARADLNMQNNNGWTALMLSVKNSQTECMNALIAAKSNPNIKRLCPTK